MDIYLSIKLVCGVKTFIVIMGMFQSKPRTVKEFCEKHPNWTTSVLSVSKASQWLIIAEEMFKDGIVHGGRLCVLQYFTECVVYHLMKNDMEKDALEINGFYSSYKYELTHPSVVTIE